MANWGDHWIFRSVNEQRRDGEVGSGNGSSEKANLDEFVEIFLSAKNFLCGSQFLYGCRFDDFSASSGSNSLVPTWRIRRRMKTTYAALVLCLNIGVDPPDSRNVFPCAKMECWIDPLTLEAGMALKEIGAALCSQYRTLQSKACFKLLPDPTIDDVRRLCRSCRTHARDDRVLFHYNGHGVLKPNDNGDICVFNKELTEYIPLSIHELDGWLKTPSLYVFDCSAAGALLNAFVKLQDQNSSSLEKDLILLAACQAHENLPRSDDFPADMFTSCLTSPIKMGLRWLCSRSLLLETPDDSFIDNIPGNTSDRNTHLGELNWIFTAVADAIAWNILPNDLFSRLFRQDPTVANLFRNFLLAERILRSANCSPVTYPLLPPAHHHQLWDAWDMATEIWFLSYVKDPEAVLQPSSFFDEQLTALEVSLNHTLEHKKAPERLPIILWALPSQHHRFRALVLLDRFSDMGAWAMNMALSLGMYPYILKLLRSSSSELRQSLISIWAKILKFDKSCQADLVKDGAHLYFVKYLNESDEYPELQPKLAFILSIIVNENKQGKEDCLTSNLIDACLERLQANNSQSDPLFLQWLCLCLGKLWEDYPAAQNSGLQADATKILAPLLLAEQPKVRASAAFAIGNLLGGASAQIVDDFIQMDVVQCLLNVIIDGSPLVRFEVAVALARFACIHKECMKPVAIPTEQYTSTAELGQPIPSHESCTRHSGLVDYRQFSRRVIFSSPAKKSVLDISVSENSSQSSDSEILVYQSSRPFSNADNKVLDSQLCCNCVSAFRSLSKDPSLQILNVGKIMCEYIGINDSVTNIPWGDGRQKISDDLKKSLLTSERDKIVRSSSWLELRSGIRRTRSVSYIGNLQNLGLADPVIASDQSSHTSEDLLLPQSSIYDWSLRNFSTLVLNPTDDDDDDEEEISTRREERKKYVKECIMSWSEASGRKPSKQFCCWNTEFESGVKNALLEPFSSHVIIAGDETEQIRIWNYREDTMLNSFDNSSFSVKGVTKLCLINELDNSLLLVASRDGNVRIWRDYAVMGEHKLATSFYSLSNYGSGHYQDMNGTQDKNPLLDWQQLSGYLYVTGMMSSIVPWDMNKEQPLTSFPSSSDSGISALCASQEHSSHLAGGFEDGSVRLYDIRAPEMNVCTNISDTSGLDRVIGVGFAPRSNSLKVVDATQSGDLRFLDMRNCNKPYACIKIENETLTSFAIHRHAHMVAIGSKSQPIKVYDMNGNILDSISDQHSLNLQKNGSVSCVAFHPYEVILAAGGSNGIVSLYGE